MNAPAMTATRFRDRLFTILADYAIPGAQQRAAELPGDRALQAADDDQALGDIFTAVASAPTDWEAFTAFQSGMARLIGVTPAVLITARAYAHLAMDHTADPQERAALLAKADRALNGIRDDRGE